MNMKTVVFGLLAASISLGAVSSAFAASTGSDNARYQKYRECYTMSTGNQSTEKLVENCAGFIVDQGIIQSGPDKGKTYAKAYPTKVFAKATSNDVTLKRVSHWNGFKAKHKYQWRVAGGYEAMRTKELAPEDVTANLDKVGLKRIGEHVYKK